MIDVKDFQKQIDDAIKEFQKASVKAETALEKQLIESAILVENDAKAYASGNVDTGLLVNSITHRFKREDGQIVAEVGTNVFYAPYIEYGTGIYALNGQGRRGGWSYQDAKGNWHFTMGGRPYPFMTPALEQIRSRIDNDIAMAVKGALENGH